MADRGEFLLKGYFYNQVISFKYGELEIQLASNEPNNAKLALLKAEEHEVSETGLLEIKGQSDRKKMRDLAIDIKNLLSIALGRRVIFDRQRYSVGNSVEVVEIQMSNNSNQGEQIVPDFEIRNYLEKTLPQWTNYSKQEKDDIFTVTDYLNQTRHDFIEDRILRTVQAWECCANYWTKEIVLSEDLVELKNRISNVYRAWKKERLYEDDNGQLGKRITSAVDQEKLILRLNKLVAHYGLHTSKIDLNLKKLKDLRDMVAHTGRINISGGEAIKILQPGIQGLQLLLLKRLGYDGLVNDVKNNWRTIEKIGEYFV